MSTVALNVKNDVMTIVLGDYEQIYSFDHKGRLITAYVKGTNYRRGLDNRLVVKNRAQNDDMNGDIRRSELVDVEKDRFLREANVAGREALCALERGSVTELGRERNPDASPQSIHQWLQRIGGWDVQQYQAEQERFLRVYRPVTILPPDQYVALVLQITEGCSWNKCTFCNFYEDRGFHIKSPPELRDHIWRVKDFAGTSMSWRKNIFLADANALVIPHSELLELLDLVHDEFEPIPTHIRGRERWAFQREHPWSFDGLYSFMDVFGMRKLETWHFDALAERHVKRIYIGLETGDDSLLQFLNKRGTAEQAVEAVRTIKRAGINVGVIVMAGVGGLKWHESHVEQTIEVVESMGLGVGDIIYLSPFVEHNQSEYARRAREVGVSAASPMDVRQQLSRFRKSFRALDGEPNVSIYDIRDFVY